MSGLRAVDAGRKVILQNTRAKIDKLHKAIMNRNVQNKKIKP